MRMMFVTSTLMPGGAERHAITLMNRLAERGHEVHAVYVKDRQPSQVDRLRLDPGGSARCLKASRYFDLRALADFARHVVRVRPAVIVAANPYALMYAWIARFLARSGARLIVTWHSTRLLGPKEFAQMLVYRLFFWSADHLVFVCERQRSHWLRRGVFARHNDVIYNGVDTDAWRAEPCAALRSQVRRAIGFADDDYVIGLSALLRPEKNHVQLVDAVALLRRQGIPARALMIGEGETRAAVEERARQRGVTGHIVITGFQRDVRPFIAACDAMVLCSFTEAFSLAAVEAMALGKPVVHADVGGAAEMIDSGRDGFLFPVRDTAALATRLMQLADPQTCRRMGERARAAVEARFSERLMVDRYEKLIRDVAAGGGGAVA
jgi:glycosyltransferase involved in cell wall biosynthesis